MGCSCGPEIYEQKNISCGEKAKPNFPKLLRYSLSLDRHFSIAVFKAYLKVCPKNWSPEKKLILEQEKLQSSDLKMLTASENTVIKTAVLQATASKGTSCLGEQSLPSGENKSRATSNTVSLPVFPWNDSHEARSHWDTASSAEPQRVTRAWPGQWAGAVVWRGGRDQAPNKKTSFRRPHSYGSPNRPPRPTTPHRAHNASRCSPAGWRSAEEPVRRPWWGRGDGGVVPTARVRASPHGCRPYRAPLRFTSVRGTSRGAGTPSRLWIGWREGASPLIRWGWASGFEAGSRARRRGAAPALPVARAPALCAETYFGWTGQLTHPEFGSEVLALSLREQTLTCVANCLTFTPRALPLEVLWARATLSRLCGAVRLVPGGEGQDETVCP